MRSAMDDVVEVTAGKPYFIQAIETEYGGGDNLAVAFRYDGDPDFQDADLPILGHLFSSRSTQKSNSELLVLITPAFVKPFGPGETPALPQMPEKWLITAKLTDFSRFSVSRRIIFTFVKNAA